MTVFQTRPVKQPRSQSFPARPYIAISTIRPVEDYERSMVDDPAEPRPARNGVGLIVLVLLSAAAWVWLLWGGWR